MLGYAFSVRTRIDYVYQTTTDKTGELSPGSLPTVVADKVAYMGGFLANSNRTSGDEMRGGGFLGFITAALSVESRVYEVPVFTAAEAAILEKEAENNPQLIAAIKPEELPQKTGLFDDHYNSWNQQAQTLLDEGVLEINATGGFSKR